MKRIVEFVILSALTLLWAAFVFWWLFGSSLRAQTLTIRKAQYTSVYDLGVLCPHQVAWTLRASDLGDISREPNWKFNNDIKDKRAKARHADFSRSGYDRGHLCPAQDRSANREGMKATFAMSNVAPQAPSLNRGTWKHTEDFCRAEALRHDSLMVVVMPVFLDRDTLFIGSHRVAVPHAFFKAAWVPGTDSIVGCWFYFNY